MKKMKNNPEEKLLIKNYDGRGARPLPLGYVRVCEHPILYEFLIFHL